MEKVIKINSEPSHKKGSCIYCGDAPVPHRLFYFASLVTTPLDNHIISVTQNAPEFLRKLADLLMFISFETFIFLKLARLSGDINKAKTFRSRVIWDEAKKRGIDMKQLILLGKPLDQYQARMDGKHIYFNSLPIPPRLLNMQKNWDDKFVLKKELLKNNIPAPNYFQFPTFYPQNFEKILSKLSKPIIVKPRAGSRGRHTVTNIHTPDQLHDGIKIAGQISAYIMAEEHLVGDVCRATFVNGKLMGFYRGGAPFVVGDGTKTVRELILEKDEKRPERVGKVEINKELESFIARSGFSLDDVVPANLRLALTYRTGRFFGGVTKEMLDELHPSFIPILNKAAKVVDLPVVGFDCIVPDPMKDQNTQRWGIIECNTLPFIDLHYYALEGKPQNIAGAIWDLWK